MANHHAEALDVALPLQLGYGIEHFPLAAADASPDLGIGPFAQRQALFDLGDEGGDQIRLAGLHVHVIHPTGSRNRDR